MHSRHAVPQSDFFSLKTPCNTVRFDGGASAAYMIRGVRHINGQTVVTLMQDAVISDEQSSSHSI
jgi:hypothetical protein